MKASGPLGDQRRIFPEAPLKDFFTVAPTLDERGWNSPGSLAFIRDVLDRFGGPTFSQGTRIDEAIFTIAALAIGVFGLAVVVRHRRANAEPDTQLIVYFACMTYALAVPRMKPYSFILLLIPTLALIRLLPRRTLVPAAGAALAVLVVFPLGTSLLPFRSLSQLFYEYMSLTAAFAGWVGFCWVLKRKCRANAESAPPTLRQLAT